MAAVSLSVDIPRPVADVWEEVARLDRHTHWMADAERIDFLGERRSGTGTSMRVRTRVGPLVVNDLITVEGWEEQRRIAVSHRGLVSGTGSFKLEPVPGGTRFTWREELRFPWYLGGGLTSLLAGGVLRRVWRGNLRRFAASVIAGT